MKLEKKFKILYGNFLKYKFIKNEIMTKKEWKKHVLDQ